MHNLVWAVFLLASPCPGGGLAWTSRMRVPSAYDSRSLHIEAPRLGVTAVWAYPGPESPLVLQEEKNKNTILGAESTVGPETELDEEEEEEGEGEQEVKEAGKGFVLRTDTRRYVGRCAYDGSAFRGWQDQDPRLRTVQGQMNRVFRQRFSLESVHVTGSSRTDHGVHANGQAFHFDLPAALRIDDDFDKFVYTMNRMLPDDIKIYNVMHAPAPPPEGPYFHAIASATRKHYSYRLSTNDFVPPRQRKYCTHVWQPLDLELFNQSLSCFIGTHDFAAFANRIESTTKNFSPERLRKFSCRRRIDSIVLRPDGAPGQFCIDIHLSSALYRMVRNVVGTSLLVGTGRMPLSELQDLLHRAPSRKENRAKSAPPEGLTLEHVYFDSF